MGDFGWSNYLRSNPRPSLSLSKSQETWSPKARVRYNTLTDISWSATSFMARPLSHHWRGTLQPLLAINPSRLVVAAGHTLHLYQFATFATEGEASGVKFEGSCSLMNPRAASSHISEIEFIPDGGLDQTLAVAFDDGVIERVVLSHSPQPGTMIASHRDQIFNYHEGGFTESLTCDNDTLLSLASTGRVALAPMLSSSPITFSSESIDLKVRSWSARLSMKSSTPYAAFGTSSTTPLVAYPITNSELSPTALAVLRAKSRGVFNSAVYGISGVPPSSPLGSSPQLIVSGWYDGFVCVHDLRSSTRGYATNSTAGPAPLLPVVEPLYDSWCPNPIYSVSCGGGSSAFVAAGSARHGVVSFWDVRTPKLGWSVHSPGNDWSPVYSLILESSRLFGATQSRPFVYDFGAGITSDTYPYVRGFIFNSNEGCYVTKYSHDNWDWDSE